jgi:hypothetical protein
MRTEGSRFSVLHKPAATREIETVGRCDRQGTDRLGVPVSQSSGRKKAGKVEEGCEAKDYERDPEEEYNDSETMIAEILLLDNGHTN